MQQQQHATVQSVPATVIAAAPTLNANAQAALMILLTAQMQSQTGETSILQNPHVVGILQNLVNQAGDPTKQCETNVTELLNDPALSSVFRIGTTVAPPAPAPHWQPPAQAAPETVGRYALLETPKSTRPILLGDAPPGYAPVKSAPVSKDTSPTPPMVANNLNNLLNAQNLNQLLGSLTDVKGDQPEKPVESVKPPIRRPAGPRPVLLGDPPGLPTTSLASNPVRSAAPGIYSFAPPPTQTSSAYQTPTQLPSSVYAQPNLSSVYTTMTSTPPQMISALFSADQQLTMANNYLHAAAVQQHHHQQQQQQLFAANQFLLSGYANLATSPLMATAPPQAAPHQFLYSPAPYPQQPQQTNALGYGSNPAFLAGLQNYALSASPQFQSGQLMAPPVSSSVLATPPSLKRKLPIPPSPEASPEGPYIGQHSQGLGGHYAESYWRQKRAKN